MPYQLIVQDPKSMKEGQVFKADTPAELGMLVGEAIRPIPKYDDVDVLISFNLVGPTSRRVYHPTTSAASAAISEVED